jgi:hypothetical protein
MKNGEITDAIRSAPTGQYRYFPPFKGLSYGFTKLYAVHF